VLAAGTSSGPLEWEHRVLVALPQPAPAALVLKLQPPAEGAWAFTFAGATFFDAPLPAGALGV
jgi:hypothetical protein